MNDIKRTLVIGLGNTSFGDDGIGPRIARIIAGRIDRPDVTIIETNDAGLDFLDLLSEYDKAVIIDVFNTPQGEAGRIYRVLPETLVSQNNESPHKIDFVSAIELGKRVNAPLPGEIVIFGIETGDISTTNKRTPIVEAAIPTCVERVLLELN
jgi:hydrogenase maturation protease